MPRTPLETELRGALVGVLSRRLSVDELALGVYTAAAHAAQIADEITATHNPERVQMAGER